MRLMSSFLLIAAVVLVIGGSQKPGYLSEYQVDIEVTVTHGGAPLEGAVVKLDLNNNGIWEVHFGEPQAVTGTGGLANFNDIVSIQIPGGDDPTEIIDWHPSRILTGNLRGAVGARDVQFDFVLPAGIGRANLCLYDIRGRLLAGTDGVSDLALDVPGSLPSGVYFVRLSAGAMAPVTHRITSVGQRAQTIRARQLSAAEAVAAGWLESRAPAGKQRSRDERHPVTIMVSHVDHGGMNQAETVIAGLNEFTVAIPVSPESFVYIPAGTFVMGSPEDEPGRYPSDGPQHLVTLTNGLYMSKYEVTEGVWYQVMGGQTSPLPQRAKKAVNWDMAVQFCNALSVQQGLTPAYTIYGTNGNVTWNQSANGYRLPTEAEWEYACRAGSTTAFANGAITYPDGCSPLDQNLNAIGWYCGNRYSWEVPSIVGHKQPNGWGLYDMHGNVYEWVWCGWGLYTEDPVVDPVRDVEPGMGRVLRGGDGWNWSRSCRSASRTGFGPTATEVEGYVFGIRVVRSVPNPLLGTISIEPDPR